MNNQDDKQLIDSSFLFKRNFYIDTIVWLEDNVPGFYTAERFYRDNDIFHPSRIFRKITNVARWLPLLWNDYDWDYYPLYKMLHQKIKFMKEHHRDHHNHTDWEEVVAQLQTVEDCLDRLLRDNYLEKEWDAHRARFPRDKWFDSWVQLPDGSRQMPSMSDDERDAFKILHDEEERLRQADLDTLGQTISRHVRGWWD